VDDPETVATAIRIGNPASWGHAVAAAEDSDGAILAVEDAAILEAYRLLALEGIFCEPASAASVAGLLDLAGAGRLERGSLVACVLTGHGLKDPERAVAVAAAPPASVPADAEAVAGVLGLAG
jgi:threonine synthase